MSKKIQDLVQSQGYSVSLEKCDRILEYYNLLVAENQIQNLTRLIELEDFVQGHLVDVLELLNSGLVQYPALDIGSGGGIPGLLAALLTEERWILVESEKRKAEYLKKAVDSLQLQGQVEVFPVRVEDFLKNHSVHTLVARAVGPVERIYSWIRKCSTWNKLVLLKGPGWKEEWESFSRGKFKNQLKILSEYSYKIGADQKSRLIIQLGPVRK